MHFTLVFVIALLDIIYLHCILHFTCINQPACFRNVSDWNRFHCPANESLVFTPTSALTAPFSEGTERKTNSHPCTHLACTLRDWSCMLSYDGCVNGHTGQMVDLVGVWSELDQTSNKQLFPCVAMETLFGHAWWNEACYLCVPMHLCTCFIFIIYNKRTRGCASITGGQPQIGIASSFMVRQTVQWERRKGDELRVAITRPFCWLYACLFYLFIFANFFTTASHFHTWLVPPWLSLLTAGRRCERQRSRARHRNPSERLRRRAKWVRKTESADFISLGFFVIVGCDFCSFNSVSFNCNLKSAFVSHMLVVGFILA